jgi:hypothetical protein
MIKQKVDDIVNLLDAMSLEKLQLAVNLAATKKTAEAFRYIIFSEIQVKSVDAARLLNEEYEPILVRMEDLCANRHYKEAVMLGLLFLKDYNSDSTLYGEDIVITKRPVTKILYFLCEALLEEQQYHICYQYTKLLAKIAAVYPDYFDEYLNERISEMFSELNNKIN